MRRIKLKKSTIAAVAISFGIPSISFSGVEAKKFVSPEFFSAPMLARDVLINGTSQGPAWYSAASQYMMLETAVAENANLKCEREVMRSNRRFCLLLTRSIRNVGDTLELELDASSFKSTILENTPTVPVVPELRPGNLGFLNYNLGGFRVNGNTNFSGGLAGGLRLGSNAFDVGGVVTRSATLTSNTTSNGADLLSLQDGKMSAILTDAAYRRSWFDRRLSLVVGRASLPEHGLIASNTFDGLGISKANVDNQGFIQASRPRGLSGYLSVPGVMTYRVGSAVLRQIPLPAGPYSIDPSVLDGLPPGGTIEIIGVDGKATSLDLPFLTFRQLPLFKEGGLEWNANAGRIRTRSGSFVPAVTGGLRYGMTNDVTGELATLLDRGGQTFNLGVDARLPFGIGLAGLNWATQRRQIPVETPVAGLTDRGWAVRGYYDKTISQRISVGADFSRNANGGVFAGGYDQTGNANAVAQSAYLGSFVQRDLRMYVRTPLFIPGISGSLRFTATDYVNQPRRSNYVDIQVSGSLGSYGSWGVFARTGTSGYGSKERSINVYWSLPLDGSLQATLSHQSSRLDGRRAGRDRTVATLSGARENRWNQSDSYNTSFATGGDAQGNYQYESDRLSVTASGYRVGSGGVAGSASMRGAVILTGDEVVTGRSIGNSVVVVRAPDLPNEGVFQELNLKPTTMTDRSGNAVIPFSRPYQFLKAHVDSQNGPMGLEVPDNILNGAVHPYRGYVVDVSTHLATPVRIFVRFPPGLKGVAMNADVMGLATPVEDDGSIYIEDIGRLEKEVKVFWKIGEQEKNCTIGIEDIRSRLSGRNQFNGISQIQNLACH